MEEPRLAIVGTMASECLVELKISALMRIEYTENSDKMQWLT